MLAKLIADDLLSDENGAEVIAEINKAVDIPIISEKTEKAIKPENVAEYHKLSKAGQLKFVVGSADREWDEMDATIKKFRDAGVDWPVWVMPTGAREEEQTATAGKVAEKAFKKGYNVAARVHVYLFGNAIGT